MHAVGEKFDYNGVTLEAVEVKKMSGCDNCYFEYRNCAAPDLKCLTRADNKEVIFKEVKE